MKLTVKEKVKGERERRYPYFGKWEEADVLWIVLFTGRDSGMMIVAKGDCAARYAPGYTSTSWGEDEFTPFYGTITIEED